jgi:hypothetical protein
MNPIETPTRSGVLSAWLQAARKMRTAAGNEAAMIVLTQATTRLARLPNLISPELDS